MFPGSGTFFCTACGWQLALEEIDNLPHCPRCGASAFRRDSIFVSRQDHSHPTTELAIPHDPQPPSWLRDARRLLPGRGRFLVLREDDGNLRLQRIEAGWTRIGRSHAADLRLDDPSVSRRHALIVSEPPKAPRVMDDRSLNGVFLNGSAVEWGRLSDGDELRIGRYRLFALVA